MSVENDIIYGAHPVEEALKNPCLLYTSDAADDLLCVDLGGRRILKKKTRTESVISELYYDIAMISRHEQRLAERIDYV